MLMREPSGGLRRLIVVAVVANFFGCSRPANSTLKDGGTVLPFGSVDNLSANQRVRGIVNVAGWALAEDGVEAVTVYVDRKRDSSAHLGTPRPDVAPAHGGLPDSGTAGWTAEIDTGVLTLGWHEITIQARSKTSMTRDLASIPVSVEK
jgi:hypothetical protein